MYDQEHIVEYWRTLDLEGKFRLLVWISNELADARARIWLAELDGT